MRNIVLDTNCLPMCAPSRSPYRNVIEAFLDGKYCLCVTTEILAEYEEKLAEKSSPEYADYILTILLGCPYLREIRTYYKYNLITADPDDNKFVNCAVAANAEYIVSNDHHFNVLKEIGFPHIDVIKIQEFSEMCRLV